jgi:glycosyltransferase involved in cell wall biosynthesis
MLPDLSVIICTRDRSELLRNTLGSIVQQQCAPWIVEIVVVDNGSTDDTKEVVSSFADKGVTVKYLYEPQQRIGHIRSVGFEASEGRYIAYLDDDAVPVQGWCATVCKTLEQLEQSSRHSVGALGGPIEPVFEGGRPQWFSSDFDWVYAIVDLGTHRRQFPKGGFPVSANMALLRSVHLANPWDDSARMCEDADLCRRIEDKGLQLIYVPEMKVYHYISERRLTHDWLANRYFTEGLAQSFLPLGFLRKTRLTLAAIVKLPFFWVLSRLGPSDRRFAFHCKTEAYLGYWSGFLGIRDLDSSALDRRHAFAGDNEARPRKGL